MTMSAEPLVVSSARYQDVQGTPMRVPDFFIVGHQKCGTTALYRMLREHPQLFMSDVKEPRFFVSELLRPERELSTLKGYLSLFTAATAHQLVGDASPQYIRSHTAAERIAEMQPAARIIVILREPASFLRSFHVQMVHRDIEKQRDLRKALALEEQRRQGRRIPRDCINPEPLMYSDHVRYVEQLERYRAAFGEEQMLILIYDDFRADNEQTVRRVLHFLGADETVPVAPAETSPREAVRLQPLRVLADRARIARHEPAAAGVLGRTVNRLTPAPLRAESARARWRRLVYKRPAPPDRALEAQLRVRFRGEVMALSEYLGRDLLGEWGYDRID
jgi:hypothetical protein